MSIISELVKKLRAHAQWGNFADHRDSILMREAADTIEELSAKLQESKPVKHGLWLNFCGDYSTAECSCCGHLLEVTFEGEANGALWEGFKRFYKYCPICGAQMDSENGVKYEQRTDTK